MPLLSHKNSKRDRIYKYILKKRPFQKGFVKQYGRLRRLLKYVSMLRRVKKIYFIEYRLTIRLKTTGDDKIIWADEQLK